MSLKTFQIVGYLIKKKNYIFLLDFLIFFEVTKVATENKNNP